jgi:hypothetical protein
VKKDDGDVQHRNDKSSKPRNDLVQGIDAFRAAIAPQEGAFSRGATYILNDPKSVWWKPSRRGEETNSKLAQCVTDGKYSSKDCDSSDNEKIAQALMVRDGKGRFVKKDE